MSYLASCLCGKIKFEIKGAINDIVMCHCSLCRKAQGSAFATNANVASSDIVFTSGEDNLTGFESSPGQTKYFCKTCGSPVISTQNNKPEIIRIRLGLVESTIIEKPIGHTYVDSKANWESITGDIPQFKNYVITSKRE